MFNKKAQTATEYMIILAVVIIIALIVVGVLGEIPGLGGGTSTRTSQAYWQAAEIAIVSYSATEADAVTLNVQNNKRDSIIVEYVNVSASGSTDAVFPMAQNNVTLVPGQKSQFTAASVTNICNAAGDAFTIKVWMKYTDTETGAVYSFTGEGNNLEGTCAE